MKRGLFLLLASMAAAIAASIALAMTTPEEAVVAPARAAAATTATATAVAPTATPLATIRQIGFRNGFRYPSSHLDGLVPPVVDGAYVNGAFGDSEYYVFSVGEPVFVDLDDDGAEEAAVRTSWNGGGTGFFDELVVFELVDGQAQAVAEPLVYGDRAFGGISAVSASRDALAVDVYLDGDGSCCPTLFSRERIGLADGRLVTLERGPALRVVAVRPADPGPQLVRFASGTSSAVIELPPVAADQVVRFEAVAGQRLELQTLSGHNVDTVLTHLATGSSRAVIGPVVFTASGDHELIFTMAAGDDSGIADAPRPRVMMSITSNTSASADRPSWQSDVYATTLEGASGPIHVTAAFPVFDDEPAVNVAIETWIAEQVDPWVAYALSTESSRADNLIDGEFEMHYRVTMVSEQLVSIEFSWYEYVCCRPYPNYGYASLVVNRSGGRVLDDADLVDVDRVPEIEARWFDALRANDEWRSDSDPSFHFGGSDNPAWSSLTISPAGLTFGTDRAGALPATSTFVSFADLGPLVKPVVVAAASNGSEPPHGYA